MATVTNTSIECGAQHGTRGGGRHGLEAEIRLHSRYGRHIGRVGALAVALGIGAAVASTPGVAWADDTPPAQQDNDGGPEAGTPETSAPASQQSDLGEVIRHTLDRTADNVRKVVTGIVRSSGGAHTSTHGSTPGTHSGNVPEVIEEEKELPDNPPADELEQSTPQLRSAQKRQQQDTTNPPAPVNTVVRQFSQPATEVVTRIQHSVDDTTAALHINGQRVTAALTPMQNTASDPGTAARFGINSTDPAPQKITAAPEPGPVIRIVSGFLAAIGFNPAANNTPVAPVSGPTLLGALGLIRRELEHLFLNKTPDVTATPTGLTVDQSKSTTFTVPAVDADGERLTYTVTDGPGEGDLSAPVLSEDGITYTYTYTADPDAPTTDADDVDDTFTLTASDATAGPHFHGFNSLFSAQAAHTDSVTVTVDINDAHIAPPAPVDPAHPYTPDALHIGDPTGTVRGTVHATDPQGLPVTYSYAGPATTADGSTVTVNPDGSFVYTPSDVARHAAAGGADTFAFTVTAANSRGASVDIPVSVPVGPTINQDPAAPSTLPARAVDHSDGTVTSTIGYADPDADTLHYANPAGGTATSWATAGGGTVTVNPTTGAYTYTPEAADRHPAAAGGAAASDSFDVVVSDGHGSTQTVTVHVPIDPTNQAPAAPNTPPATTVDHSDGTVTSTIGYADPDADTLHYANPAGGTATSWATAGGGTVTVNPTTGAYTYTPEAADRHPAAAGGAAASDSFDVVVSDGHGSTQTVTVHVPIDPTNQAPAAPNTPPGRHRRPQ